MRALIQILVILAVLIVFGAAKLRYEDQLNQQMVEQRLIQPPLEEGTSLRLGQTSAAVALGGLRSLVAAMWNLKAFVHFENLDWIRLEESYEAITTLQPQTTHYWDTGAWHLHTNASVHFMEDNSLSPMRRKALRRLYIDKGSAFLEEGIRQNPDNWRLRISLARLWSDRHKIPDLPRSVKHYDEALATETMPGYKHKQYSRFRFYTMARVKSMSSEALQTGRTLFNASPDHHLPNLVCTLFALQHLENTPAETRIPDEKLFPSPQHQYTWLKNYLRNRRFNFPMDGVQDTLDQLEKQLNLRSGKQ